MRWLGIGFVAAALLLLVVPSPPIRPAAGLGIAGVVMLGLAALMWNRRAGVAREGRVGSPYRDEPVRPMFTPRADAKVQFESNSFAYWMLVAFFSLFLTGIPILFISEWTGHTHAPPFFSREFRALSFGWTFAFLAAIELALWRVVKRRVVGYEDRVEVGDAAGRVVYPLASVISVKKLPSLLNLRCGVIRVKFADAERPIWFVCAKNDEERIVEFLRSTSLPNPASRSG